MKKKAYVCILSAALCAVILSCSAALGAEPQEYIVYLPQEVLTLQSAADAADTMEPVPFAEGYYKADSLRALAPLLAGGQVRAVPNERLELLADVGSAPDPAEKEQWYLNYLGASSAWEAGYTGKGVTVALVDSGINKTHEDLNPANVSGCNFLGNAEARDPSAYEDDHGHGTLTAGILAAVVGNGLGGAGLTPDVSVLALRSFSATGGSASSGSGTLETALSAIGYAMERGADVINLSIGGSSAVLKEMEPLLQQAADQGILLVSSCGNAGSDRLYYPAAFDCVVGVGWVDEQGMAADKSQHNGSVFVTAPGSSIYGPGRGSPDSYRTDTGSSFAAPMVSALGVMAKQANPAIDQNGFMALLQATAEDKGAPGWDAYYGHGIISVSAFVEALEREYGPLREGREYTLTFQTNGGSPVSPLVRAEGSLVNPAAFFAVREGYDFTGWYTDPALTKKADSVKLTGNQTVYAGWKQRPVDPKQFPFTDVTENDWFRADVEYVWRNGLMNGVSQTRFQPGGSVTRGMVVTILYRAAGEPPAEGACPFSDVKAGSYYEPAILWASENGVVTGYSAQRFGPDDAVTREQMAAILYRYAKGNAGAGGLPLVYKDWKSISSYARDAMSWCITKKIITGVRDDLLVPKGTTTRAQSAAILHRLCDIAPQ